MSNNPQGIDAAAERAGTASPESGSLAERLFVSVGTLGHTGLLAKPNSSKGEMSVLATLHATSHALSPTEIAQLTNVSTSRTANTLKTLERKGLITRTINPSDRRGIVVSLTPKGAQFESASRQEAESSIDELLGLLAPDEAAQLVSLVEKLSKRAVEKSGIAPPPIPLHH